MTDFYLRVRLTRIGGRYWAALVEKAAAKLRGSYAKMEAISMRDSLTMLAGAACVSYNKKDDAAFVNFELCDKWQRRGALFLASHQGEGTVNGIHGNHAYSVLQVIVSRAALQLFRVQTLERSRCSAPPALALKRTFPLQFVSYRGQQLVKLRNPWGRDIWRGQWSPASDKYLRAPDELLEMLGMTRSGGQDFTHGEFVMAWADFIAVFDHVCLAIVSPRGWMEATLTGRWPAAPKHLWQFRKCTPRDAQRSHVRLFRLLRASRFAGRAVFAGGRFCTLDVSL